MKKIIILALITLISFTSFAQSDPYLTVTYKGYSNGQYAIKVDSKQAGCNPDITISCDGVIPTAVYPNPKGSMTANQVVGASTTFYITAPLSSNAKFYVKDLSICQWLGSSPSTINVDMVVLLPLIFQAPPHVTHIYSEHFTIEFSVGTQSSMKTYNVQVSKDNGTTWDTYAVVIPDNTVLGKTYSVNVNFK